jgi:hypothetical protein
MAEKAKGGDTTAARLLLERYVPAYKPAEEEPEALPMSGETLTEQGNSVMAAVAAGRLTPGAGGVLLASLVSLAKLTEADDLERRIAALEESRDRKGKPVPKEET